MRSPFVTVVIPVYNREGKVGSAIKSVLNQSYDDFELIVVDDASRDDSVKVVKSFDDSRLRTVVHSENKGGSAARNSGIDAAKGEWVAFLDSDDIWMENKLERSIEELDSVERRGDSERAVVFSSLLMETPESTVEIPTRAPKQGETIREYVAMGYGLVHTITMMMRTEFAREVRWDEDLPVGQDADFSMRLDAAGATFYYIDEALAVWQRTGADHVSGSTNYRAGVKWLERNPELLTERQQARYLGATLSRRAIRAGEKGLALKWIMVGMSKRVLSLREILEFATALALTPDMDQRFWSKVRSIYHGVRSG